MKHLQKYGIYIVVFGVLVFSKEESTFEWLDMIGWICLVGYDWLDMIGCTWKTNIDVRSGSKVGQIGPKWDKSGTF